MPLLENMKWPDVEKNLKINDIAVIPVGAMEQHGKHMPFKTDTEIARAVSIRIGKNTKALVIPTIQFGLSTHHMKFPGTITLTNFTFINLITDICDSLIKHGFKNMLIINAHGGNTPLLTEATRSFYQKNRRKTKIYLVQVLSLAQQLIDFNINTFKKGHSDRREASVMLYLSPETVDLDLVEKKNMLQKEYIDEHLTKRIKKVNLDAVEFNGCTINSIFDTDEVSKTGGWGSLEETSAAFGEKIIEVTSNYLIDFINELGNGLD